MACFLWRASREKEKQIGHSSLLRAPGGEARISHHTIVVSFCIFPCASMRTVRAAQAEVLREARHEVFLCNSAAKMVDHTDV